MLRKSHLPLLLLACTACSPKPSLVAKHEPLFRAGKALEGAIAVGVNQISYDQLLRDLAREILIAEARASSDSEKQAATAYRDALGAYRDAVAIWKATAEDSSKFEWAKGAAIVEMHPELAEVATKYKIATPEQVSPYGNKPLTLIEPDAVQTVWKAAAEKEQRATALYLSLDTPPAK